MSIESVGLSIFVGADQLFGAGLTTSRWLAAKVEPGGCVLTGTGDRPAMGSSSARTTGLGLTSSCNPESEVPL